MTYNRPPLPLEIVSTVLGELSNDFHSLRSFSLVSPWFRSSCQKKLFEQSVLKVDMGQRRNKDIKDFLASNPAIASSIKHLSFTVNNLGPFPDVLNGLINLNTFALDVTCKIDLSLTESIQNFIVALPKLREVVFSTDIEGPFNVLPLSLLEACAGSINNLTIKPPLPLGFRRSAHPANAMTKPKAKSVLLSLDCSDSFVCAQVNKIFDLGHLKVLRTAPQSTECMWTIFQDILDGASETLQEVGITLDDSYILAPLRLSNLHNLTTLRARPGEFPSRVERISYICDMLESLPRGDNSLETLILTFVSLSWMVRRQDKPQWKRLDNILSSHASKFRCLRIQLDGYTWEENEEKLSLLKKVYLTKLNASDSITIERLDDGSQEL